jgi:hypothetical protein
MSKTITALLCALGAVSLTLGARAAAPQGDYVEARTASVFAGACHYSGEYVSDGRDAVQAWHFAKGDWQGVSLSGLSALAVVRADNNLAEPSARRVTHLYLDAQATPAQRQALTELLTARCGKDFGRIASVESAPIAFAHRADGSYQVTAPQIAALSVQAMPDRACCKQPNLVWYQPLAPISNRRVGYTQLASCTAKTGGEAWTRSSENSAFYGAFTF